MTGAQRRLLDDIADQVRDAAVATVDSMAADAAERLRLPGLEWTLLADSRDADYNFGVRVLAIDGRPGAGVADPVGVAQRWATALGLLPDPREAAGTRSWIGSSGGLLLRVSAPAGSPDSRSCARSAGSAVLS